MKVAVFTRGGRYFLITTLVGLCLTGCSDSADKKQALYPVACADSEAPPLREPAAQLFEVVVDTERSMGLANNKLAGVGWNTGSLTNIEPLKPHSVRIDANLHDISPSRDGKLQLDSLLSRIKEVRQVGAEPLVILYPTPRWLGEERAATCTIPVFGGDCDSTRVAATDLDAWEELIVRIVRAVATAPVPALVFEVWNEPDLAIAFWQDTPEAFLQMAIRSHRAIERVEEETGLDLSIGGPGLSGEFQNVFDGVSLEQYIGAISSANLPLDFVSWHHYANSPLLGPDGNEGFVPDQLYDVLSGINPETTPSIYGEITRDMRSRVASVLPSASALPDLYITEWNLSSGGLDIRHDTHEGAAFVAASLIEMERAGLSQAMYYRSIGGDAPGDWGMVRGNGSRKPTWEVFKAWEQIQGQNLAVEGDDPSMGIWTRAVKSGADIYVFIANFLAVGGDEKELSLTLQGNCQPRNGCASVIDQSMSDFDSMIPIPFEGDRYQLHLPAQSVALLQLSCATPSG